MYESFYGLNERPFNLTPDPRFLYLSIKHKEAFAHLLYGIRNRGGFVMVSGEIGTGKTTICRSLLKQLDPDTEVAFIFNPKLSPEELLRTVNADFGIASDAETVRGLIDALNAYLLEAGTEGKNCVLIIDEAQNLGTETLEQVRLLSNLETETQKLLQIVLIGQPELSEKLEQRDLRQLNQRITARYHLDALNYEETLHYIAFRLRVAGGRKKVRFTRSAVKMVYKISQGTPRVINAICDRALLIGYTQETHVIKPALVKRAAKEVQGDRHLREVKMNVGRMLPASAFAMVSALAVMGVLMLTSGPTPTLDDATEFANDQWVRATDYAGTFFESSEAADEQGVFASESAETASSGSEPVEAVESLEPEKAPVEPAPKPPPNVVEAALLPTEPEIVEHSPTPELVVASRPPDAAESAPVDALEVVEPTNVRRSEPLSAVLRAWNLAVLGKLPNSLSQTTLRGFAAENGLAFAGFAPSFDQLMLINLPAIIRLRDASGDSWVTLLGVSGDSARVATVAGEDEMPLDSLRVSYAREAVLLWSDPNPDSVPLRALVAGDSVLALQGALGEMGLFDREASGVYDAGTIEVITQIQRSVGLTVDGIVGPRTRMVLNSWQSRRATPNLLDNPFSEDARRRVLASPGIIIADGAAFDIEEPEEALPNLSVGGDVPDAEADGTTPDILKVAPEENFETPGEIGGVSTEPIEAPRYDPQLSSDGGPRADSATFAADPLLPIFPASPGSR